MTYSAVPTKATGDLLAASDWNTYVRDNLADHEARITGISFSGCVLTRTTDQTIPDSSNTLISFSTETIDQGGWFPGSGTTITVPAAALPAGYTTILVSFSASIFWDSNSTGSRSIGFLKNGTEYGRQKIVPGFTGTFGQMATAVLIDAVPGDTFEVQVAQGSGGNLALVGSTNPVRASLYRVGYF